MERAKAINGTRRTDASQDRKIALCHISICTRLILNPTQLEDLYPTELTSDSRSTQSGLARRCYCIGQLDAIYMWKLWLTSGYVMWK